MSWMDEMNEFPTRIGFDEALRIIREVGRTHALAGERLALARCHDRVLAEDVVAGVDLPNFDNSAMDGFAVRHADLADGQPLQLVGEQFAGIASGQVLAAGQCLRITTGAPIPAGADTVVIKEDCRVEDGQVRITPTPGKAWVAGRHVRRAGEDVRVGDRVLQAGQVLTPARIGLAASLGLDALPVTRRPTVAVFTTGDELVEPGLPLQPGQIHNSNRDVLMGLLRRAGLEPTAWPNLPDEPARLAALLRDAADNFDVVITCGAVSAGEKDHIPELLQSSGQVHFWKARIKPGMPVLFGELGRALMLCLPGNPVSVLATFTALGVPLLDAMQARHEPRPRWHARLSAPWNKHHPRLELLRGALSGSADGTLRVTPNAGDGSHRMRAAADSNVLLLLPEGVRHYAAGDVVECLPML